MKECFEDGRRLRVGKRFDIDDRGGRGGALAGPVGDGFGSTAGFIPSVFPRGPRRGFPLPLFILQISV